MIVGLILGMRRYRFGYLKATGMKRRPRNLEGWIGSRYIFLLQKLAVESFEDKVNTQKRGMEMTE